MVFQVPDQGAAVDAVSVVATAAGVTVVAAGGVAEVVPEGLVQPAAISIRQTRPARIRAGDFFMKRSFASLFSR